MLSEIGSNFWISPLDLEGKESLGTPSQFGCGGSDYVWLSTGRSAIKYVLKHTLEHSNDINKVAILPSYTCNTVIGPFLEMGFKVYGYDVDERLNTSSQKLVDAVKKNEASVLLIHRYFGFNTLPDFHNCITEIKEQGVSIIEDCTQSLYSSYDRSDADYYVGSIRKWSGVPDGGFAVCKEGTFDLKPTSPDEDLEKSKIEASLLKYDYLFNTIGDKAEFKRMYREAEDILDNQKGYYLISDTSRNIQANLNVDVVKKIRRSNYKVLADGLKDISDIKPLYRDLPLEVTPLYFPLVCINRDCLQGYLADHNIYAPVVWPKADNCPKVSSVVDNLYNTLLCIPIDQRYDNDDMNRVLEVINNFK